MIALRHAQALARLVTLRPCKLCGGRIRCWRWHVEYLTCPTCLHEVSEMDPEIGRVFTESLRINQRNTPDDQGPL